MQEGIDISRLIPPLDIAFAWHVSFPTDLLYIRQPVKDVFCCDVIRMRIRMFLNLDTQLFKTIFHSSA